MSDPVRTTHATYDAIAEAFHERTRTPEKSWRWAERFAERAGAGALVGDLGCGPGRDLASLRELGLRVFGLDRSLGMLRAGIADDGGARVQADLRALPIADASLGGGWANASLLHLAPDAMSAALGEIARILRPGAPLHVTLKRGEGAGYESERYGRPRWFQLWTDADLDAALGRAGFDIEIAETRELTDTWLLRQCVRR